MLRFEHPEILWYLLALPALAVFFAVMHRWRSKQLAAFASTEILRQLAPDMSTTKRSLKQTLAVLALGFLILAFANPQLGTRLEEVKREGIDLFVALDVSLSMKAEDIRPSRLEKAKRDVSALLNKLRGDRVGLIVFAGDAFVQFPLTSDYSAADLFISAVDVDAVPTPGTMIASAMDLALKSFSEDLPTQKAIIIVSDGENTEGDILTAVEKVTKAGVKVYTVGMGTTEGGPIPIYNAAGARADYKRDRAGSIVLTRLDESTLQQISASTGGSYRRATSGGNEIDEIFEELSALERVEFGVKQVTGFESMYQYPLAMALLLFLLEFLLSERRGTVLSWLRRLIPAAVLVALSLGAPSAHAQTHRSLIGEGNEAFERGKFTDAEAEYKKALQEYPDSRVGQFNLGDAYYKQDRFDEARQAFETFAATGDRPHEVSQAFYNMGNTLFKAEKLDESIEAYKQALRINPNDDEARHNLELARRKKKEEEQKKQQNKEQQKQEEKKEEKQENKQKNEQQQQDRRQQQQNQQPRDQQPQPQPQTQQNQIPKDQADRILEALRNSEKEIQKQIRKREGVKIRTEKDW
jgi:Ca-activated chloride channel family protein